MRDLIRAAIEGDRRRAAPSGHCVANLSYVYNHHEREVFAAVMESAPDFPDIAISQDLLCDVACVALNRLPARYVRHDVDLMFYLTEHERHAIELSLEAALVLIADYLSLLANYAWPAEVQGTPRAWASDSALASSSLHRCLAAWAVARQRMPG